MKIDLTGTELELAHFTPRKEHRSKMDWLDFKIEDKVFEGAGDASKLEIILGVFLDWARRHDRAA